MLCFLEFPSLISCLIFSGATVRECEVMHKYPAMSPIPLILPRNMDTGPKRGSCFQIVRTEAATPTVPPPPIVITFDIIKHRCPHFSRLISVLHGYIPLSANMKEVQALSCSNLLRSYSRRLCRFSWPDNLQQTYWPTVRVNDNVPGPLTPPQRHLQGIAGQLRRHAWRH